MCNEWIELDRGEMLSLKKKREVRYAGKESQIDSGKMLRPKMRLRWQRKIGRGELFWTLSHLAYVFTLLTSIAHELGLP